MKVIVCEDDSRHRQFLHSLIVKYASFHEPSIEIVLSAAKPDEVLSYIKNHKADCYFLDIELESDINGMDLAVEIRKHDPIASIIFVTNYAEKLKLTFTYKIAALDFIVKDDLNQISNHVISALQAAFEKYKQIGSSTVNNSFFQIKIGERIKNVPLEDIYFFETSHQIHKIGLYEKNGYYEFYGKLKDLAINEKFFRCHKSYVINIQHIQEINKKERTVKMTNGEKCPISFRAMGELQKTINKLMDSK